MSAEPDVALLRRKILGAVLSRAIHAVTEAGVVDRLAAGPAPVAELAEACGVDAHALQRFLRALAGEGLFVRIGPDAWALTPMGALLRSDTPGSLRHLCTLFTGPAYEVWELAPYALRTGKPAFAQRFGLPMFDWLAEHPDRGEEFTAAQAGLVTNRLLPLLDHDWTGVGTVVDVGGGNGTLLAALLQDRPSMTGTVFDLPEVVEQAGPLLDAAGVSDRCTLTGGDFFASVPSGADAYVLAQILHDWDDDDALRILRRCREAMRHDARLLVLEQVLFDDDGPDPANLLDLHMLVLLGGRERTEAQWRKLLSRAGLAIATITRGAHACLIEARPLP
jgi:SAM-dependent methyltransferase